MANTFHRIGNGPRFVIALHGWFGDCRSFAPIEDFLDGEAFTYLFMDYRGYGGMVAAEGLFTIDEIASDVLDLADSLGLPSFSLVGHSMGGMAAERVACLAPERVERIVAVAGVPACGVNYDSSGHSLVAAAYADLEARRTIIDRSTGNRLPRRWVEWKADYSWERSTRAAFAAYGRAWVGTDFHVDAATGHPLLAVVGEHDPKFTPALMEATTMVWHPEAEMVVLPNAGHYPMNETPLALVTAIETFLIR